MSALNVRIGLFGVVALVAPSLSGAGYNGTVLYELTPPSGFSSGSLFIGAAGGEVVGWGYTGGNQHALLWTTGGSAVDLNPSGFDYGYAWGTSGNQQVGAGSGSPTGGVIHALLWTGTADSAVDLTPSGDSTSVGIATNGSQQVGWGTTAAYYDHALLWTGSAASAVDLNPSGFDYSYANGISDTQQVGYGYTGGNQHALLWNGTADSAVDLHPSGFDSSTAYGTSGNQQVGAGVIGGYAHALLWTGTAASAVDLNPNGFDSCVALSTNGTQQVGYGSGFFANHALLWSGTAASGVDLNSLLPASGDWASSSANTIDSAGNIFGVASGTFNGVTDTFAVEWSPSPLLPGDFNRDGHVDASDIEVMMAALVDLSAFNNSNQDLTDDQLRYLEDVNGDGVVNNADLQALLNLLKSGDGSADSVPEPASIVLLGLGTLATAFSSPRSGV